MEDKEQLGIILMTHGGFAKGLMDAATMIYGRLDNVTALELEEGMEPIVYSGLLEDALAAYPQGALILIDLFGGTPSNVAMIHARKAGKALPVVGGLNMPMLLSVLNTRGHLSLDELVAEAESSGNAGIVNITKKLEELFDQLETT